MPTTRTYRYWPIRLHGGSAKAKPCFVGNYYFKLTLTPRSDYPASTISHLLLLLLREMVVLGVPRQAHPCDLSYISDDKQAPLDLIIRCANEYYINWHSITPDGQSAWLYACGKAQFLPTPMTLDRLVDAGCNVLQVDDRGWNCLFHCVVNALLPFTAMEFQVLMYLLERFHDVLAKDKDGLTIIDHVRDTSDMHGSYRRHLWTTALARAGFECAEPCTRGVYMEHYLPEHHLAMRHLESWSAWEGPGILEQLRSLSRTSWSLKRDILQIMSYLQSFREEKSKLTRTQTLVPTTRVMGMLRLSLRPQVVVSRVHRERQGDVRGKGCTSRFFRMITMTRRRPRHRERHSDTPAVRHRCHEILNELGPRIEGEIAALDDLTSVSKNLIGGALRLRLDRLSHLHKEIMYAMKYGDALAMEE